MTRRKRITILAVGALLVAAVMRPVLKQILANPNSQARKMASVYLERFDMLDRRAAGIVSKGPSKPSADHAADR